MLSTYALGHDCTTANFLIKMGYSCNFEKDISKKATVANTSIATSVGDDAFVPCIRKIPRSVRNEGLCVMKLKLRLELVVRTEHIHNLVDVHLLHVLASGLQVLTRIEVLGMLSEVLTDGSSHSQA